MPIEPDIKLDKKVRFWNRLYRIALLSLVAVATALAAIGVGKVFTISNQIDRTTKATNKQVQCIATYFTQSNRQTLKIANVDQCDITRVK